MKKIIFITLALLITVVIGFQVKQPNLRQGESAIVHAATVYKTSECGCCDNYLKYLKSQDVEFDVVELKSIDSIKEELEIPQDMYSCHTTIYGDYVVEGHVPMEAVNKLLLEKPKIKGIALPDMPSGSPGMPGKKEGKFIIYSINGADTLEIFTEI